MKKNLLAFTLLFTIQLSFASQTRKVLIIGIDGVRSDALQQAATPNLNSLLSNATYTYDSWHTGITWSGPSWSTILTGVNWNKHGIINNGFAGANFAQYPPLPTLAKQIKATLNATIVAEWDPLLTNITNADWNKKVKVEDGKSKLTADSTIIELQNPDLDLLFTYFDQVDLTGHTSTFTPTNPLYISAIQSVDTAIGRILTALYARPNYASEDWLILVVTDHGGQSFFHGGNTNNERHIWWIASGNAVASQLINKADPSTYNCNTNNVFDTTCVNYALMRQSPVHADVTVTALHHLIYDSGIHPETYSAWNLDGKSWLTTASGIGERDFSGSIAVYPNPTGGVVHINCDNSQLNTAVEVYDVVGKRIDVTDSSFNTETISIKIDVPTGMYLLKIKSGNQQVVKKIQVMR